MAEVGSGTGFPLLHGVVESFPRKYPTKLSMSTCPTPRPYRCMIAKVADLPCPSGQAGSTVWKGNQSACISQRVLHVDLARDHTCILPDGSKMMLWPTCVGDPVKCIVSSKSPFLHQVHDECGNDFDRLRVAIRVMGWNRKHLQSRSLHLHGPIRAYRACEATGRPGANCGTRG